MLLRVHFRQSVTQWVAAAVKLLSISAARSGKSGCGQAHAVDMHIEGSFSPKWVCKQDVRAELASQLAGISVKEQLLRYLEHHKAQGYWFERQNSSSVISVIVESLNWNIMPCALFPSSYLSVSNIIGPTFLIVHCSFLFLCFRGLIFLSFVWSEGSSDLSRFFLAYKVLWTSATYAAWTVAQSDTVIRLCLWEKSDQLAVNKLLLGNC